MRWLLVSATYKRPDGANFRPLTELNFAVVAFPSAKPATIPLKNVKPLVAAMRICWHWSYTKTMPLAFTAIAQGLVVWVSVQPATPVPAKLATATRPVVAFSVAERYR
jgi:hypothetical protein